MASLGAGVASAAFADEQCGERPNTAPALQPPLLLTDWAWLARYRDDNAKLIASGVKVDTVFLGDSITEGWVSADAEFFSKGNVGRGISAQTTPQILVRMHADVIALKPRVVHIMAGTNDIAHNTGPMTAQESQNNLMAMCEIAQGAQAAHRAGLGAAGIEVLVETGVETQARGPRDERVAARLRETGRREVRGLCGGAHRCQWKREAGAREGRSASNARGLCRDARRGRGRDSVVIIR